MRVKHTHLKLSIYLAVYANYVNKFTEARHGTNTTNYKMFLSNNYSSFHSASCFYDIIQVCNLRTCKDYRMLFKNRTLMFRRVILVINAGISGQI